MMRTAISPLLAIRIFFSTGANVEPMDVAGSIPEPDLGHVGGSNEPPTVFTRGSWVVRHVRSTTSTNAVLIAESEATAQAGQPIERTALMADFQTAGRGRLDRTWEAPAGENLMVSVMFPADALEPVALTQAVGVAAVTAVETLQRAAFGPERDAEEAVSIDQLGLKWPNDVLLAGRKLAGVLAQRSLASGAIVVGIGLNVGWCPPGAASLAGDLGLECSPLDVLEALLDALDHLLVASDAKEVAALYRDRLITVGQRVRVELPNGESVIGRAEALADDGRLVVVDDIDGKPRVLDVGDIVHLRPAAD